MSGPANRRAYIDWMRGLSVLFMMEAHTFDSWTLVAERGRSAYFWVNFIGGLAAPMFLFLAGAAVAMAGAARERRTGDRRAAAWSVQKRGWEIFGLAFLFRLQAFILSPGSTVKGIFKADILNIMGPSIAVTAWLWGRILSQRGRLVVFGAMTCAFTFVTPLVRQADWIAWLPDVVEWYIRPLPRYSVFTFFPWAGYVCAGVVAGELLNTTANPAPEWRMNQWFFGAGAVLLAGGYGASFLPSIYPAGYSNFWTSSPIYYFMKIGIMLMLMAAIYFYIQRPFAAVPQNPSWSPMLEFGRSSLFVYWIHVELAYGIFSYPLHKRLTVEGSFVAFLIFSGLIFGVTVLKTRLVARRRAARLVGASEKTIGSVSVSDRR